MKVLTPQQAAERTGLAIATLSKLRHYGGGPAYFRIGRLVRYRAEHIDAWLAERPIQRSTSDAGAVEPVEAPLALVAGADR